MRDCRMVLQVKLELVPGDSFGDLEEGYLRVTVLAAVQA